VRLAEENWDILDYKSLSEQTMRKPLPIKIQVNKRFLISKGRNCVMVQAKLCLSLSKAEIFFNLVVCSK
jgi:hypothetical protein